MTPARHALLLSAVITAIVAGNAAAAHAHAFVVTSDPPPGAVLPADRSPRRVSLRFSEPVTATADAVTIRDATNKRVEHSGPRVSPDDPTEVTVEPRELASGAYVVRWRVTSVDNHVVRGTHWFVVGFAATPPPAAALLGSDPPRVPALEVVARWLGLLAALGLAGTPLAALVILPPARVALPGTVLVVMTAALVVAQLLGPWAQAMGVADADGTIRSVLLEGRFAVLWWTRLVLGVVLGGLLVRMAIRPGVPRRGMMAVAGGLGVLLLGCIALTGHAASGRGALPVPLMLAVDTIHLGAAALWLGGLLQIAGWLAAGPGLLAGLVRRLSNAAVGSVTLLLVTGAINTYGQVGSLGVLPRTAWGQSLLLKLALLLPLLAIAAINLFVMRPRLTIANAPPCVRRLFPRLVRAELTLAATLLVAVGLLGSLPPPGDRGLPSAVETARLAGSLRVALRVDPNWVGVSRFHVVLSDADGRVPTDIARVTLTFAMDGMNMGRTSVTLMPRGSGAYETTGFYVGMPGLSLVNVAVNRGTGADESAVFRIEVPDVNARQLAGLAAALGLRRRDDSDNPVRADDASLVRGRTLYQQQCALCHGESGRGDGPAAASLLPPPADLTLHTRWHPDAQLFWFVSHGVSGTSMAGFAERLAIRDRWDVINHLHALAQAPGATAGRSRPVSVPGPPAPASAPELTRPPGATPPSAADGAGPAGHAGPPTGRLVFGPDFDNNLWLLQLGGDKPVPLTTLGPREFSSHPVWSPDGRRVAFSHYRLPEGDAIPVPDGTDLYLVNADGSGLQLLAAHDATGVALQHPAWSSDGMAVYVSYVGQGGDSPGIDRVDVRSRARTRIVTNGGFPTLSGDGRRLAYIGFPLPPARGQGVWSSAPDGSGARQIVAPGVFDKLFGLRLAPDGKRLLFAAVGQPMTPTPALGLLRRLIGPTVAQANGDLWDLWIVDVDGRNLRPLTALAEDLPVGAWAPDGRSVAFLGGGSATSAEAGLTIIGVDGTGLRRLTTQPGHRGVDWTAVTTSAVRKR